MFRRGEAQRLQHSQGKTDSFEAIAIEKTRAVRTWELKCPTTLQHSSQCSDLQQRVPNRKICRYIVFSRIMHNAHRVKTVCVQL